METANTTTEITTPDSIQALINSIPDPDTTDLDRTLATVEAITTIDTGEDYELAARYLQDLKSLSRALVDQAEPFIKAAHQLHRGLTERRKKLLDPVDRQDKRLRQLLIDYDRKVERERIEAERKAREEAEAQRREQQQRLEDEAQTKADKLAAEGRNDEAEAVLDEAVEATTMLDQEPVYVPSAPAPVKTQGVARRQNWTYEVTDLPALIKAAAAPGGEWLMAYLTVDEKVLGSAARTQKDKAHIPGVRIYDKGGLTIKSN